MSRPDIRLVTSPDPKLTVPDLAIPALPEEERYWVPQGENVWFRPLMMNTVMGGWSNLLRIRGGGILGRHRHPGPVHGLVIKGAFHYLEHDWVARAGYYVFEPPGITHTLVVDQDGEELIVFFTSYGAMIHVNDIGQQIGYEDVFTKIEMCRSHYRSMGIPDSELDKLIY
jgi:anti-sigma factor ChrR (cupin superfamily)